MLLELELVFLELWLTLLELELVFLALWLLPLNFKFYSLALLKLLFLDQKALLMFFQKFLFFQKSVESPLIFNFCFQ